MRWVVFRLVGSLSLWLVKVEKGWLPQDLEILMAAIPVRNHPTTSCAPAPMECAGRKAPLQNIRNFLLSIQPTQPTVTWV